MIFPVFVLAFIIPTTVCEKILSVENYYELLYRVRVSEFPLDIKYWHGTLANRVFPVMKALSDQYPETELRLFPVDKMLFEYQAAPLCGEFAFALRGILMKSDQFKTRFLSPKKYHFLSSWEYSNGNYKIYSRARENSNYSESEFDFVLNSLRNSGNRKYDEINAGNLFSLTMDLAQLRLFDQEKYLTYLKKYEISIQNIQLTGDLIGDFFKNSIKATKFICIEKEKIFKGKGAVKRKSKKSNKSKSAKRKSKKSKKSKSAKRKSEESKSESVNGEDENSGASRKIIKDLVQHFRDQRIEFFSHEYDDLDTVTLDVIPKFSENQVLAIFDVPFYLRSALVNDCQIQLKSLLEVYKIYTENIKLAKKSLELLLNPNLKMATLSEEQRLDVLGRNVPIIFATTKGDNFMENAFGEFISKRPFVSISKDIDVIISLERDYQWIRSYLVSLGAPKLVCLRMLLHSHEHVKRI